MRLSPHPITLRQLQYIVAVADRLSFRAAADECHVSQPSLSAQIAQAEEALGVQVFERDQRKVMLTPAGQKLVARARALLVSADDLVDAAKQLSDPFAGTLRLGIIPTLGPYLLPDIAPALRQSFRKLRFVWVEEKTATLARMLAKGELDAAIVALEAELGDVSKLVLGTDEFVLAAPPEHALSGSTKPLKAEELDGEPMLLLEDGHCFRDQALAFCAKAGAEELALRATSLSTLTQMVAGGTGVTLLPKVAVPAENRRKMLHIRPFAPKSPLRTVALVWRPRSPLEATLVPVGEALKESYAKLSRELDERLGLASRKKR